MEKKKTADRYEMMTSWPIRKVIPAIAVPSIISMLVTAFYNMADTYFVSRLGTAATGAVGINFSLMTIIQTFGMTFGVGAGSYISRLLGQQNKQRASQTVATAFYTVLMVNAVIGAVGLWQLAPLMRLLGATESILPYSRAYASYILLGAPFMAASFVLNNSLRSEGLSMFSMIGITAGSVLNIVLDPICIFTFGWGVAGAAIATVFSQLVSFGILVSHYLFKRSTLSLSLKSFTPTLAMYREILKIGLPTFLRLGLMSVASIVLNNSAAAFGDAAIAALSICNRVMMFFGSALIGFGQGFQPVAGFNYGAKRFDRVWDAYWFSTAVGVGCSAVLGLGIYVAAPVILGAFKPAPLVLEIGTFALRAQALVLPLQAYSIVGNMLFQSIGHGLPAAILSLSRQGLLFVPLLIILPRLFGLTGLQLAQCAADTLAVLITVPLLLPVLRRIGAERQQLAAAA